MRGAIPGYPRQRLVGVGAACAAASLGLARGCAAAARGLDRLSPSSGRRPADRLSRRDHADGVERVRAGVPRAPARARLGRRPQHDDRVPLGGGPQRTLPGTHGRVRPPPGGCHRHVGDRTGPHRHAGDQGHPDRVRRSRRSGRHRDRRKPGAAGRQRHRPVEPADRPRRQPAGASPRGRAGIAAHRGDGQRQRSKRDARNERGSEAGPQHRPRGRGSKSARPTTSSRVFRRSPARSMGSTCAPIRWSPPTRPASTRWR